ncbi:hypothetical protein [Alloacidobacterium sp.]|uniref:hypothetical protein n=1 Tax=Alloacidobacterium sp. TaxID=2951999 RepID=UPI002D424494|nr:hypothetical protein [Alloacidobacterium sp.]HYK36322.1 hypothetical protein [Alloacidobacterium sp.]
MESLMTTAQFMRNFEYNSNVFDMPALIAQFAETIMVAGTEGVNVVRASDFASVLPKRKKLFDEMGCRTSELISMKETAINTRYRLIDTQWRMLFADRTGACEERDVLADSTFVIDIGGDDPKIILYMPHQDIISTLKNQEIPAE